MELNHIKELLQITLNFDSTPITHSFDMEDRNVLTVKCIKGTSTIEIKSTINQEVEYYTSLDQAAEYIFDKTFYIKN